MMLLAAAFAAGVLAQEAALAPADGPAAPALRRLLAEEDEGFEVMPEEAEEEGFELPEEGDEGFSVAEEAEEEGFSASEDEEEAGFTGGFDRALAGRQMNAAYKRFKQHKALCFRWYKINARRRGHRFAIRHYKPCVIKAKRTMMRARYAAIRAYRKRMGHKPVSRIHKRKKALYVVIRGCRDAYLKHRNKTQYSKCYRDAFTLYKRSRGFSAESEEEGFSAEPEDEGFSAEPEAEEEDEGFSADEEEAVDSEE